MGKDKRSFLILKLQSKKQSESLNNYFSKKINNKKSAVSSYLNNLDKNNKTKLSKRNISCYDKIYLKDELDSLLINNPNNKCSLCGKIFTLGKNLKRHLIECHLKKNYKRCPYCYKKYPRIKEYLLRCKTGIFSKIYALSEKSKIYKSEINNRKSIYSGPKDYYVTKKKKKKIHTKFH